MNRATVNINTQIHLLCAYFDFLGFILGSDMVGWYGSTTVSLLLNPHIHFPSGFSAWHCQHLLCFVFLMRNCNENYNVVFICISLHITFDRHQNPMTSFTKIVKNIVKFIWKHKRPCIIKEIMSNKSNAGGITVSNHKFILQIHSNRNSMTLA
jgi:hypothetical protein